MRLIVEALSKTKPFTAYVTTVTEAIYHLLSMGVEELEINCELGEHQVGLDILLWIESQVIEYGFIPPRKIKIKAKNSNNADCMKQMVLSIQKLAGRESGNDQ